MCEFVWTCKFGIVSKTKNNCNNQINLTNNPKVIYIGKLCQSIWFHTSHEICKLVHLRSLHQPVSFRIGFWSWQLAFSTSERWPILFLRAVFPLSNQQVFKHVPWEMHGNMYCTSVKWSIFHCYVCCLLCTYICRYWRLSHALMVMGTLQQIGDSIFIQPHVYGTCIFPHFCDFHFLTWALPISIIKQTSITPNWGSFPTI